MRKFHLIKIQIKGDLLKEVLQAAVPKTKLKRESMVEALKENTPVDTGNARDHWKLDAKGNIINETDYIEPLNHGHSKQAPAHFIEKTLLSQDGVSPRGTIVRPL